VLRRLDSGDLEPVELVGLLESLSLLDQQRAQMLERARREASLTRRRDEERSIRQFVLRALEEIDAPQTAGFLEDYVYARERVVLDTRGFGALRRDENRAWRRRPGHRRAYIVPCLDPSGAAVPRWMARSDWPLSARIVVPGVEMLWAWSRVEALCRGLRDEEDKTAMAVYAPLIEKYAREARGEQVDLAATQQRDWLHETEQEAVRETKQLKARLAEELDRIAVGFADLDAEQQLWGVKVTPSPRATSSGRGGGHAD
jgi:hypothetical protein